MEFIDELWKDGPKLIQSDEVFKLGTDSVLLAHFVSVNKGARICDLGCGTGVISIILSSLYDCRCTGVEIQRASCELAERNIILNNKQDKFSVVQGDLRQHRSFMEAGTYDVVITNPPYFKENSGKSAEKHTIATARDERSCSLEDIVAAASYLCRWGGKFAMVHKPENLSRIFNLMVQYKIEPKRLRLVSHKAEIEPSLVLVEGRRGGNCGLIIEKPLILCNNDGSDTEEIKKIYRR